MKIFLATICIASSFTMISSAALFTINVNSQGAGGKPILTSNGSTLTSADFQIQVGFFDDPVALTGFNLLGDGGVSGTGTITIEDTANGANPAGRFSGNIADVDDAIVTIGTPLFLLVSPIGGINESGIFSSPDWDSIAGGLFQFLAVNTASVDSPTEVFLGADNGASLALAVPEPSVAILSLFGLAVFFRRKRR